MHRADGVPEAAMPPIACWQKNGDARRQARGCRSPVYCVRHERAVGVQNHRVRSDDGTVRRRRLLIRY